ncbi:SpoIIE family protein phosphatase [Pseudorhodoferax sp.]|uniref:SpoIIE family protein phosphatase n=1 Tax=Pseudorhodoferax sp. TaxID=1993553 RepID=UPI0039E4E31E
MHLGGGRSCLGRALGATPHVEIDHRRLEAEPGATYLLASDGAYERLDAAAVHAALACRPSDLDAAARALVDTARERGSTDDATVQLLRIDALPPPDAQPWQAQRARLRLPPPLAPRMAFEGFTVVRELHASARSQVHLAIDAATGQQVALKTPAAGLREDAGALDRFLLEEWVARRLRSLHVLQACTADQPRAHLFVAMEYLEGQTLAQWMTHHPRPALGEVRGLVAQLGKGLQVTQLRRPADLRRLRYVPLRHHRPDLPAWLDAVLHKALQPDPARRHEAVSEFVHDLHRPCAARLRTRALPLVERNPVLFWQVCTVVLGLATVVLAGLRALGH